MVQLFSSTVLYVLLSPSFHDRAFIHVSQLRYVYQVLTAMMRPRLLLHRLITAVLGLPP